MKQLWRIRPSNNGCVVIGKRYADNGKEEFYEIDKGTTDSRCHSLIFLTKEDADIFIDENMNPDKYVSEWIMINKDYLCPNCDFPIIEEWSSKLSNGNTEYVYHCTNKNCGADWTITKNNKQKVLSKERFFFG